MITAAAQPLSLRDAVKIEIDTLSEEALFAVREFVLFEKHRPVADIPGHRERNIDWLNKSWSIPGFTPLTREEIYDRT
jgi:hypothetical protein